MMSQSLPIRKSPRASRYDYSSVGVYFITICTKGREEFFGRIQDQKMILNEIGNICEAEIYNMVQKRLSIDLHEYVIMPNHVHLLLGVNVWK
jgi:REP element-mobilizing transposase RayT